MRSIILIACAAAALAAGGPAAADTLTGQAAFGSWRSDAPGVRRLITPADLPDPFMTPSASGGSSLVARPADAMPKVPEGFTVELIAEGLAGPRTVRVAPNGDIFVAESGANRLLVFRRKDDGTFEKNVYASGFNYPYGVAFYPPGPYPAWLYVAETTQIVRFPYKPGDVTASQKAASVLGGMPDTGHWTRDIVFTPDNRSMLLAIGSRSNAAERLRAASADEIAKLEASVGLGSAWDEELLRAAVVEFDPSGGHPGLYASGIRNCSGLAIEPTTGDAWCATNERDGLGDNLPPDYLTRVKKGAFYGWPWYYIGDNVDPRHPDARPDLKGKVTVPDVLLVPHSAPLQIAFYDGTSFPEEYRGDGFATLHGSWNRSGLTGYKVVRFILNDGVPTGEYEDFMTGFIADDSEVWGRPVGIAVAKDGALIVSEDGNGTLWRVQAKP